MNQPLWAAASFSARMDGNCARFLEVLALAEGAENIDRIDLNAYTFGPCGPCEYACTKGRACTLEDDFAALRERLFAAQRVLFALPAYAPGIENISGSVMSGHLFWHWLKSFWLDYTGSGAE